MDLLSSLGDGFAIALTWQNLGLALLGCFLGTIMGALPGLGGSVVDWIAYGHIIQTTKDRENFGKGDVRGVLAPESANNAKEGGALIPTLLFGIPGSGSMAILLGGFVLVGVEPGVTMKTEHLDLTFVMIWSLALANVIGALVCLGVANHVAKLTKKNAAETETVGATGLKNLNVLGYAFPIPQNGVEVVWNHITRYRGETLDRTIGQVTPQANGKYNMVMFHDQLAPTTTLKDYTEGKDDNVMFYFKQKVVAPTRLAGNVLLVHETIDQVKEPRRAWVYNAGQRRVRRAPQVAYDGPGTASDGMRTADNFDMYNGSPDRYEWKLVGKREMYIAYNSYKLDEKGLPYDDMIKAGYINQDLARYELHRVWEVEGTLRSGTRHIYGKRVMFFDEDSWLISVIDHYDGRGNLWRVAESHQLDHYMVQAHGYALEALYDLNAGRYYALGFENNEAKGTNFEVEFSGREFVPAALRRSGVR